jgi:gliding motility-associated-like protein
MELFIPNVFSPNGDDHNDFFVVEGSGLNEFNIRVFNRWGQMVFESEDQSISWDGLHNGKQLNKAVFAYTLTYTDSLGIVQVMRGNVTLIK